MTNHPKIAAFFDALDAILLSARVYMKSLFGLLLFVQGFLASGAIPVPKVGRWAVAVGILNALVGYLTVRSAKQAKSLQEVERIGGSAAMARIPTPGPGAIPTVSSEDMITPNIRRGTGSPGGGGGTALVILLAAIALVSAACHLPTPVIDVGVCTAGKIQPQIAAITAEVRVCLGNNDYMPCLESIGKRVGQDVLICAVREFTGVGATPAADPVMRERARAFLATKNLKGG